MEVIYDLDSMPPHPFPVVALGNFDGVHLGHQAILKTAIDRARAAGGTSFALTFSPLPAKVLAPERAPRLLLTAEDRFELMRRCGLDGVLVVNFTRELSQLSPRNFVRDFMLGKIGARVIVVGHSVSFGHNRAGDAATLVELGREFGFEADVAGPIKAGAIEVSSTKVRELVLNGDLEGAAAAFRKSVEVNSDFARGHRALGETLLYQGRLDNAIIELRRAVELAPDEPVMHESLAKALEAKGQTAEAAEQRRLAAKQAAQ